MIAMASSASATVTYIDSSDEQSPTRAVAPFVSFNPSIREFAPSCKSAASSQPIGSKTSPKTNATTPSQSPFHQLDRAHETSVRSRPVTPTDEFDEKQAIPSTLLDSPLPLRHASTRDLNYRYAMTPPIDLMDMHHPISRVIQVPDNKKQQQQQQQQQSTDIPAKAERRSSMPSFDQSNDYSSDSVAAAFSQATGLTRRSSGPSINTQNSSESSYLNDQIKFDLTPSFESLSVRSSASSSSRSWQNCLTPETETFKDVTRMAMPVLKEHTRSSFSGDQPGSTSTVPSRYIKITGLAKTTDPVHLTERFHVRPVLLDFRIRQLTMYRFLAISGVFTHVKSHLTDLSLLATSTYAMPLPHTKQFILSLF
ncbi:hypothetical protein V1512DRAFT_69295 [Lipomyces arxii]|uniref:uncharacterized protein n=1 Tax=Lipomyces arxii TaxID=56418 RepID=UPI0034CEFF66